MPSNYLKSSDFIDYGVPPDTTEAQVTQASVLIDTYLRRPEGLIYVGDDAGNPLRMLTLLPTASFLIPAGLAPGLNVVATVTGPITTLARGTVLIAEYKVPAQSEALVVVSTTGNKVTFARVEKTHAADATYSAGLTIVESKHLPTNRPLTILSKTPVQRLLMGEGRYGYSRRSTSNNNVLNEFNLLAVMTTFGGPPVWEPFDLSHTDFASDTGQVWIPAGIMLAYYSEVRISYIAGWQYENLPDIIKVATGNIVNAQSATPLNGNLKLIKAGDTQMERFLDTVLDKDTRMMLAPYRARSFA